MKPWYESVPVHVYRFALPFVEGKERPRSQPYGHGRLYTPAKTRRLEKRIAEAYRMASRGAKPVPDGWPVRVEVVVCKRLQTSAPKRVFARRDMTKPDVDNVLKLVLDGLTGVAYADDRQVTDSTSCRALRTRRWSNETVVTVTVPRDWDPKTQNQIMQEEL